MAAHIPHVQDRESQTRGPAYRIVTARLCVRCWNPVDAARLKAAVDANVEYLRKWLPWAEKEPAPLEVKVKLLRKWRAQFDLGEDFVYGIFNQSETEVLGGTGLHTRQGTDAREIGYWIQEKHEQKGYATEASAALTKVAFEVDGVNRVHIHCDVDNKRSARIPEKLGFVLEGVLRKRLPTSTDSLRDMMVWTMLKEEYPDSIPSRAEVRAYDATGQQIL